MKTAAQIERQRAREEASGRYGKLNPCALCGKSAGYDYFTPSWGQVAGHTTFCNKCSDKLESMGPILAEATVSNATRTTLNPFQKQLDDALGKLADAVRSVEKWGALGNEMMVAHSKERVAQWEKKVLKYR